MTLRTRVNKLEKATTAESKPLLILWPVEGERGVWSDYSGNHYPPAAMPENRPIIRIEYNRGQPTLTSAGPELEEPIPFVAIVEALQRAQSGIMED